MLEQQIICIKPPAITPYFHPGTFNMDTSGLYIYTTHKLSQPHRHTLQLTSELTASKWLTIRNLVLDGLYRDRGRQKEARLEVSTPAATYVQVKQHFCYLA